MLRLTATLPRFLVLVIASALCLPAAAEVNQRRDGNWWRTSPALEKLAYVTGFFDGMALGSELSYSGIRDKAGRIDPALVDKVATSYTAMSVQFKNVTNGQLADGIDKFYEDYRNRTILLSDAVWLVVNSISGKSDAEMQTMIENFRKNAK